MKDSIQQQRAATTLATHVRDDWYRRRSELAELCAKHGQPVAKSTLHQIASGRRKASDKLVRAIVAASKGKLKKRDIFEYLYGVEA